jgi:hypothetical protein
LSVLDYTYITKNNNPDETENFPATDTRRRYTCRQESPLSKDRVDTVADPVRIVTGPIVCPVDVTTGKRGGSIVIFVREVSLCKINCVSLRCEKCVEFATVCL